MCQIENREEGEGYEDSSLKCRKDKSFNQWRKVFRIPALLCLLCSALLYTAPVALTFIPFIVRRLSWKAA